MTPPGRPTKILLCSYAFHPSIGGIETISKFLADHLTRVGLDVVVVTNSPDDHSNSQRTYGYPVFRRPRRGMLLQLFRESDLVYQSNISVQYLWPLLLIHRPLVITNHTPIDETVERSALKRWLKKRAMSIATCTSCSKYLAGTFPVPSRVIYNPVRNAFSLDKEAVRGKQLVFVGRLSDAKGIDILLRALGLLKARGMQPELTIVGGGSKETELKALSAELGLEQQVCWTGPRTAEEIACILNQHRILVVPSRRKPAEAFGIVAIEGLACGAVPVVANQGGLPEAIGPCGLTFECENPQSLADTIERLLNDPMLCDSLRASAPEFLHQFSEDVIFRQYLDVMAAAMPGGKLTYR